MRLGQFARKYDIRVQDIISYLEKADEEIHSNSKLSDDDEAEILDFFGIEPEEKAIEPPETVEVKPEETTIKESTVEEEEINEDDDAWIDQDEPVFVETKKEKQASSETSKPIPSTPEEDIALAEGELDTLPPHDIENAISKDESVLEETSKEIVKPNEVEKKVEPKEDEVIDTERLIELLESEEEIPELDKIKLIKAPKKELSGLKVLGKVDLPEPKKKEVKEEEEKEQKKDKDTKNRSKSSDDDWEERRLKARAKRLKNEARVAKLKKEKEEKERIARNAIHYKQKIGTTQPKKKKPKAKKKIVETTNTQQVHKAKSSSKIQKEQPKSVFGKMWKWLTNPDQ